MIDSEGKKRFMQHFVSLFSPASTKKPIIIIAIISSTLVVLFYNFLQILPLFC